MDRWYVIQSEYEDIKNRLSVAESMIDRLKGSNKELKSEIEKLALENSTLQMALAQKKRHSEGVKARWKFYHEHKEGLKREHPNLAWFEIKRYSDDLHQKKTLINK